MVLSLVFSNLVYAPCLGCATAMVCFPQNDESLPKQFFVYFLWSPFTTTIVGETKSGSPSCHRADYFYSFEGRFCRLRCKFTSHFRPVIMAGGALFTSGSTELLYLI